MSIPPIPLPDVTIATYPAPAWTDWLFVPGDNGHSLVTDLQAARHRRLFLRSMYRPQLGVAQVYPAWPHNQWPGNDPGYCLPPMPLRAVPIVGFCGVTQRPAIRAQSIQEIQAAPDLAASIISRPHFCDADRSGYLANMAGSDLVLCVRGVGNFSYRLYEALSVGRVPLIVDTGAPLPWETELDWRRFSITVRPGHIAADLKAIWQDLTPERWQAMQTAAKAAYTDYLSPVGWCQQLSTPFS